MQGSIQARMVSSVAIVIVEGIDRVGKTTLCNRLVEETGIPILKDQYFEGHENALVNVEKMHTILQVANTFKDFSFISDRFHWTEAVYGAFDRQYDNSRYTQVLEDMLVELDRKGNKVIMVLIRPTSIEASSHQHGRSLYNHHEMFLEIFDECPLTKIYGTYNDIDKIIAWVKNQL